MPVYGEILNANVVDSTIPCASGSFSIEPLRTKTAVIGQTLN